MRGCISISDGTEPLQASNYGNFDHMFTMLMLWLASITFLRNGIMDSEQQQTLDLLIRVPINPRLYLEVHG